MSLFRPLKALATLTAGKNDVRYYLRGIHVKLVPERKEYHLEASDGHRAARIVLPSSVDYIETPSTDTPWAGILPIEAVQDLIKGGSDKTRITLKMEERGAVLRKGPVSHHVEYLDGRYPMLDRFIPKENRTPQLDHGIAVNASYLADLGKFSSALRSSTYPEMKMRFSGPMDPILINFARSSKTDYIEIIYVLMPCRFEQDQQKEDAAA